MFPPAPVRFSMINGCPSRSDSDCPTRRAMVSVAWPAGKGTMMRTGRVGYASAQAKRGRVGSAAAPPAKCKNVRRGSFILNLPLASDSLDHLVGARQQLAPNADKRADVSRARADQRG